MPVCGTELVLLLLTVTAKSLQSCPTLWDPIPGILQAGTLEWVAISFSNAKKWEVKVKSLNHVRLFKTPWTAAYQAPPSMGFSRQEYWSGVPLPSPELVLAIIYSCSQIFQAIFSCRCKHMPLFQFTELLVWGSGSFQNCAILKLYSFSSR